MFRRSSYRLRYNFTPEDLTTNRRQLKYFLDNFDEIPYTAAALNGENRRQRNFRTHDPKLELTALSTFVDLGLPNVFTIGLRGASVLRLPNQLRWSSDGQEGQGRWWPEIPEANWNGERDRERDRPFHPFLSSIDLQLHQVLIDCLIKIFICEEVVLKGREQQDSDSDSWLMFCQDLGAPESWYQSPSVFAIASIVFLGCTLWKVLTTISLQVAFSIAQMRLLRTVAP